MVEIILFGQYIVLKNIENLRLSIGHFMTVTFYEVHVVIHHLLFVTESFGVAWISFMNGYEIVRKRTESYPLNKLLSTVYHMECNDADMSTFHRHAIPALLPYIELLVHMSWIYPNRMLWNLICGCVPTYSVIMVMFSAFSNTHSGNHPYNQPNLTLTKETMTKLFTKFKVSPTPVLTDRTYWLGSCNEKNFSLVEESDILSSNHSHLWRISERFKMCYERMSPRFHKYVTGESSLEEIDKIN